MAVIHVIFAGDKKREIAVKPGLSLLEILHTADIYLPAVCGGQGNCGKCKVRVYSGFLPVTLADRDCLPQDQLEAGYRLACAAFPDGTVGGEIGDIGIGVFDTGEGHFSAVNDFKQDEEESRGICGAGGAGIEAEIIEEEVFYLKKDGQSYARRLSPDRTLAYAELREVSQLADAQGRLPVVQPTVSPDAPIPGKFHVYRERGKILRISAEPEPVYAVAGDIGTTTLALALLDLRTGKIAGRFSAVNRQREFGGDVISRIQKANSGGLSLLSRSIRNQMSEGIAALCREASVEAGAVRKIALTGNTTMLHLLLQLSCHTLGQTPFTPVTLDMVSLMAREIFEGDFSCETVILPGISTYVGADITAGLFFTGIPRGNEPEVFMDIGTNGEMALAYKGKILCTATAAGPAFEGGNIRWGTGSVPGAIARARFRDGVFECSTIGNRPPVGICGSAVIDIVYEGLKNGLIKPSGRFNEKLLPANEIFLAKTGEGRDIVFSQKDVRELQLGKSAIRSGLDSLLNHAGLRYEDIKTLFIAGGFGFHLNIESGAGIGLIPEALRPKVTLIGNSALGGAVKFLLDLRSHNLGPHNPDPEKTLCHIIAQSEEYQLAGDRYFNDSFIDNMNFDDNDTDESP